VGIIEHEVWINARRETVFNVISTREGLDSWWGPVVSASSEIGAVIEFDHGHGEPIQMRVVDYASGERFEWENVNTFTDPVNPASEWSGTSISFDLRDGHPTGAGRHLRAGAAQRHPLRQPGVDLVGDEP
jgi:uncharacterized protein YndB with AHSA1/START domain